LAASSAFGASSTTVTFACTLDLSTRTFTPLAISSANGLKAVELAVQRMNEGWRPVDAAVAGVELVENDPEDDTVGIGGLPNEDGIVELDAAPRIDGDHARHHLDLRVHVRGERRAFTSVRVRAGDDQRGDRHRLVDRLAPGRASPLAS
jgi:hypothetical protein